MILSADAHPTASVMYHPLAGHGGFLVDFPWQQQMVQGIKDLVELPEDLSSSFSSLLGSGGELVAVIAIRVSSLRIDPFA